MNGLGLMLAATTPPPTDQTTTYVIMGGASIFIVYMMMRITKRKKKDPFETPFQARGLAQQRSVERQMENLLVELSEMSRQMTAQLDTRAAKLEALIQDADERIARLKTLNEQAPARPSFTTPGEAIGQTTPAAAPHVPTPAAIPEPVAVAKIDDVAPSPAIDPGHAEVYRLADEGKNIAAISNELNRPSGEVELILALRPRG